MTNNEINPVPDNVFFDGQGVSWNGEVDGIRATFGIINGGASETYSIDCPELVVVHHGLLGIVSRAQPGEAAPWEADQKTSIYYPDAYAHLPFKEPFTLFVPRRDFIGTPIRHMVYTCLYLDRAASKWDDEVLVAVDHARQQVKAKLIQSDL